MPFQGIDGVVQHLDDGNTTGLGQRLEARYIPAGPLGPLWCLPPTTEEEM